MASFLRRFRGKVSFAPIIIIKESRKKNNGKIVGNVLDIFVDKQRRIR